jgi:hypothetical protein
MSKSIKEPEALTAAVIFWDITEVSEEHIASIFRVEEQELATYFHAGFLL